MLKLTNVVITSRKLEDGFKALRSLKMSEKELSDIFPALCNIRSVANKMLLPIVQGFNHTIRPQIFILLIKWMENSSNATCYTDPSLWTHARSTLDVRNTKDFFYNPQRRNE